MKILRTEFDESKLQGAQEKAVIYMSRSALLFKRLRNISEDSWGRMGEAERVRKRTLLDDFDAEAEGWRRGPYGAIWDGGTVTRQPKEHELTDFTHRQQLKDPKPLHPQV